MSLQKFYFNTGVKPHNNPHLFGPFQEWLNGEKQIAFFCENVPENAKFQFACDDPNLHPSSGYHVAQIIDGGLYSKFAYFTISKP